jgi:hypothetical protein
MIGVLIAAVVLSIGIAVRETVGQFLRWECSPARLRPSALAVLQAALTVVASAPFVIAVGFGLGSTARNPVRHRRIARRLTAALALVIGLAVLRYPVDGMRVARALNDGSTVAFYHQYRIWPGDHFTPCFEVVSPTGKSRSYAIANNTRYRALPEMRADGDQSVIWFVDGPRAVFSYGYAGVWCSFNRLTGEFVAAGGPYPAGVAIDRGQELRQVAR